MMKKSRKKGMALVSVLLLMTIVLMLSGLMLTMSIYSSNMAALATQTLVDRTNLEMYGDDFMRAGKSGNDMLAQYVANGKYKYYNTESHAWSAEGETSQTIRTKSLKNRVDITIRTSGRNTTMTVTTPAGEQLLKVVYVNNGTGASKDISLKSWNYGK